MRPIKLAVIFDQQIHAGGGYQQALNAAILTKYISKEIAEPIFFTTLKENVSVLEGYGIEAKYLPISLGDKVIMAVRRGVWNPLLLKWIKIVSPFNAFEKILCDNGIDLVYFLTPDGRYKDLERLNYIATIWDLCHRDDPEFPEVRWDRRLEVRDRNYSQILPKAVATFVDSELSRINLVRRYGLDMERVYVMPFEAAVEIRGEVGTANPGNSNVDIKKKYGLAVPYVFYPAQFWAHKNHIYLLEGLADLKSRYGYTVGAIFVGSDQGNLNYVKQCAIELGLIENVKFGGFVSNEEMPNLYKQSIALVMPTYFGPTNLPPLEAFELDVPVLYPDKSGLREQVGDAALLIDLMAPSSLADHINLLLTNDVVRAQLIERGRSQLRLDDKAQRISALASIIDAFRRRRMCWE
jgi:glycosyltransferase involved in cell wall biosynthesis